ncbi:MAG: 3-hydroxyacyl-CoA dehydrogenase/enoyl-CoA hydratase family protein [bacterium]
MDVNDIETVAVLGAGNMGHGITEVVAIAGYDVVMRDVEQDLVDDGYEQIEWSVQKLSDKGRIDDSADDVMSRVDTEVDLETAVSDADLVIEAAPENMDLKKDIFTDLEAMTHDDAILASNTSSLSITEFASATDREDKICGMHFFNPPVMMELVEVIHGEKTSEETADTAYDFVESIDKTPIHVRKDVNGFVVNRVLLPFMYEPAFMVSDGEADVREVDAALTNECGYPMGPFELLDLTGIDVTYHILKEAGTKIPAVLEEKVEADELGKKSGKGFYDYENGGVDYEPDDYDDFDTLRVEARMVSEAAWLVGNDVASVEAIDTGMKLGAGFPTGICRRGDKLGLDTVLEKLNSLRETTGDDRFEPADHLEELVENGHTGEGAGEGFYDYGTGDERTFHELNKNLRDDGVLEIENDRATRLNAISPDLSDEIEHIVNNIDTDEVRVVTFEGAGDRAFSAGADVTSFTSVEPHDMIEFTTMWDAVAECPVPTVAKIQGFCLGGGLELALACDLRIASEDSEFGFPEINLGLIPGAGGTQRTMKVIGESRAKELVYRGIQIDADKAEDWGLINHCLDTEEFEEFAAEFIDDIASGPPIALRLAKKVMDEGKDAGLDAGITMEREAFGLLLTTDDLLEGMAAFGEDDVEPDFKGK